MGSAIRFTLSEIQEGENEATLYNDTCILLQRFYPLMYL